VTPRWIRGSPLGRQRVAVIVSQARVSEVREPCPDSRVSPEVTTVLLVPLNNDGSVPTEYLGAPKARVIGVRIADKRELLEVRVKTEVMANGKIILRFTSNRNGAGQSF
jgi:hypothetical protein